jgi:hypothetical protein
MTRIKHTKFLTNTAIATSMALAAAHIASAVPVTGQYLEDPRCDTIPSQTLSHELGAAAFFPINEAFTVQTSAATFTVCVADDLITNDWIVQMTNVSGQAWTNLFFVGDLGMKVGNADGNMIDVIGAPGVATDAFRIDAVGLNPNLLGESILADGIFAPGETWRFNVSNFAAPNGGSPPPLFHTPGVFAGSSPLSTPPVSTASILAVPVPEPSTFGALGVAAAALLMRRRRRT